jgi:hypothetical protein
MKINCVKMRSLINLLADEWLRCDSELELCYPGEELDELATIYFLCDKDDNIQYIGQTKHLNIRMSQHTSNPSLLRRIDWNKTYYFIPPISSQSMRLMVEGVLILLARPVGNQAILLKKTAASTWSAIRWRRSLTYRPKRALKSVKYRKKQ